MDISEAWEAHDGRIVFKSTHYLAAHQRHLARFQGTAPTVVEVGVYKGGSLQLWRRYFGEGTRVIGCDIDPACKEFEEDGIEVMIGDQADPDFLAEVAARAGTIDVLIDDGGHMVAQQLATFDALYPCIAADGVYVCEDVNTSYDPAFGPGSFVEEMKARVDEINAWLRNVEPTDFTRTTAGICFYPALIVVEKAPMEPPMILTAGEGWPVGYHDPKLLH